MSYSVEAAMPVMAILFNSMRLGVGKPIILAALLVMRVSLAQFLTESMLKR